MSHCDTSIGSLGWLVQIVLITAKRENHLNSETRDF